MFYELVNSTNYTGLDAVNMSQKLGIGNKLSHSCLTYNQYVCQNMEIYFIVVISLLLILFVIMIRDLLKNPPTLDFDK